MKNFLSAVYSEMSNRLKTPLLGTFALCWVVYNHSHVAKLVFSDNAQRLLLIEKTPFYWLSDLFIPLGFSLLYIFIIPVVQWGLDIAKYNLIEKHRTKTHHAQLLEKYRSQTRVAKQQSKASAEYWNILNKNHAENAAQQIINLKAQVSSKMEQIRELEVQNRISESNYSILMQSNETLNSELTCIRDEAGTLKKQLNTEIKNAQQWQTAIEEAVGKIESSEPSKLTVKFIQDCSMKTNNTIASLIEKIRTYQLVRENPDLNEQVSMLKSDIRKLTDSIFEDLKNILNDEREFSNSLYKALKKAENPEYKNEGFVVDTSRFTNQNSVL